MTVDDKDWSFCGGGLNTSEYLYNTLGTIENFENDFNLNQFKPSENSVGPVLMNNNFLQNVGSIFENRSYHIMHCLVYPSLIQSFGEKEDYFEEQNGFYRYNRDDDLLDSNYYRAWMPNKIVEIPNICDFEHEQLIMESLIPQFLIHPMQSIDNLDKIRVEYYKDILNDGIIPTVLAIGMVEMRTSLSGNRKLNGYLQLHSHVCDGHHKLFAASQIGKPVYLLLYMLAGDFMWYFIFLFYLLILFSYFIFLFLSDCSYYFYLDKYYYIPFSSAF
jgi:hypothetical protein